MVGQTHTEHSGGIRQDVALAAVHQVGLDGVAVVIAHEVKGTVSDQQVELQRQRHPEAARLTAGGLGGDDDLAHQLAGRIGGFQREGQHVGAPADSPVPRVQSPDLGVVHDGDLDLTIRTTDRGQGAGDGPGQTGNRDRDSMLAVVDGRRHQRAPAVASSESAAGASAADRAVAARAS
jgi:hypothetical protein